MTPRKAPRPEELDYFEALMLMNDFVDFLMPNPTRVQAKIHCSFTGLLAGINDQRPLGGQN
jgi:hypothetical protein